MKYQIWKNEQEMVEVKFSLSKQLVHFLSAARQEVTTASLYKTRSDDP